MPRVLTNKVGLLRLITILAGVTLMSSSLMADLECRREVVDKLAGFPAECRSLE